MAVSNTADLFYQLFNTFTTLATIVAVVVFGLMTYFVIKYRARGSRPEPEDAPTLGKIPQARGHRRTAIISVGLSSIILSVLIFGTFSVTDQITSIPPECTPRPGQCLYVQVAGYRFAWNFTYPNGVTQVGNLTIPTGRIVVLEITSKDVFHSFGIGDFRIKKDAIPGLNNKIWFIANEQGIHSIRCFELCGSLHAFMTAKVTSVGPGSFSGFCSSTGC
jgi:cytochrome c oxidase subunit 2